MDLANNVHYLPGNNLVTFVDQTHVFPDKLYKRTELVKIVKYLQGLRVKVENIVNPIHVQITKSL